MRIYLKVPCKIYPVRSTKFFFQAGTLKKAGCHTYKSEKKSGEHPKKIWVDATVKKYQVAPYKNMGRFYRVPFKSILRVQIKWAII